MDKEFEPKWFLTQWKKVGMYVLPVAIVGGLLVARLGVKKEEAAEDYVCATVAFDKWKQVLDQDGDAFAQLESVVKKHPELYARYDAAIGQNLLVTAGFEKAAPFVERTLLRAEQPYYSDYARTSLKISEEKYEEALEEALALKERMGLDRAYWEKSTGRSSLFAFNLMRIAALSKELDRPETELGAWKEIKLYANREEGEHPIEYIGQEGFDELLAHFSVGNTTLLDYIEGREEELRKP